LTLENAYAALSDFVLWGIPIYDLIFQCPCSLLVISACIKGE
jgi:hypothetical protein